MNKKVICPVCGARLMDEAKHLKSEVRVISYRAIKTAQASWVVFIGGLLQRNPNPFYLKKLKI